MAREYDVLAVVRREISQGAIRYGLTLQQASELTTSIDEALRAELGTTYPYIPCPDKGARNQAIVEMFKDGVAIKDVAKHFGLSVWHTRCILQQQTAES